MQLLRSRNYLALWMSVTLSGTLQAETPPPTVGFEVTSRSDAFGGIAFDKVGVYEQVTAIAHMRIDPVALANHGIVDLAGAARDANGMVHYDVDVQILRPRDSAKARHVLIYDVVNRGNKTISAIGDGSEGTNAGAIFLARRGYTIVWSGWQGDITSSRLIGARFPVATDQGRPMTARISSEVIFDAPTGDQIALPYPTANLDQSIAQLTVRQHTDDRARTIAPGDWRFDDERHVTLKRPPDMDAGAIYRFSYVARDPRVMGLGFASVRDIISFLRHGDAKQGNPLADFGTAACERSGQSTCGNGIGGVFSSTVAFGLSQSGRYLRDFLWQGFNRDLTGSRVFDGMLVMIAGGRRTFTNMRFAEPGRFSRQHEDHDVPGFDFPFTYGVLRDSVTGRKDGILSRCERDQACPKLFHVDTSAEFWQAGASLVGTGGTNKDVTFPKNVRAYMIAGGAHAPGVATAACQSPANPLRYAPIMRALLIDLVDWTTGSRDPPASRWPRMADSTSD
jgi:Alpha/beta hydrolase domain